MSRTRGYRDLIVWNRGIDLVTEIYRVSRLFPADERFGLTSQIRRAAVSVPSNIAEGSARLGGGHYAVADEKLYYGSGDRHEVRVYRIESRNGFSDPAAERAIADGRPLASMVLEQVMRRTPDRPLDLTPAQIELYKMEHRREVEKAAVNAGRGPVPPAQMEQYLSLLVFPTQIPAQTQLLVDAERNVWEQRHRFPGDTVESLAVYDREGSWLGLVEMPRSFTPYDIGADYVLGVWRDEADVESVRLYALQKM